MSLIATAAALSVQLLAALPPLGNDVLVLPAADLAAVERSLAHAELADGRAARYRTPALQEQETHPDLALLLGNRRHGAQVELGALGGGREDAPGLVHIGVGFDF